jgi:hypothetical protein
MSLSQSAGNALVFRAAHDIRECLGGDSRWQHAANPKTNAPLGGGVRQ